MLADRTPTYCVAPLTIGEGVIAVTGQPVNSILTVFTVDEGAGTGEGLVVCWGTPIGEVLADRDAAVAKFTELAGRPPEGRELP